MYGLRRLAIVPSWTNRKLSLEIAANGFKTSSTEHPVPIYDQGDKHLEKVLKERKEDLVILIKNKRFSLRNYSIANCFFFLTAYRLSKSISKTKTSMYSL